MIFDWPLFVLAVALLWLPRAWMHRGPNLRRARPRRASNQPAAGALSSSSVSFRREFSKSRNYYDILRTVIAGYALAGGAAIEPVIRVAAGAPRTTAMHVLLVQTAVLVVGVVIQTVRFERRHLSLAAPVFYVAGLAVVLCTPLPAISAFAIAWLLTSVVPNVQAFLMVLAMIAGVLGTLLNGIALLALVGVALCVLPVLLSLLAHQPLVVFSRRSVTRSVDA